MDAQRGSAHEDHPPAGQRPATAHGPGAPNAPVGPLDSFASLVDLAETVQTATGSQEVLSGLAQVAQRVVPGADAVSVTLLDEQGRPRSAACSNELAARVDQLQYQHGQGPCMEASSAPEWISVTSPDLSVDQRWPALAPEAASLGVRAALSVSLLPAVRLSRPEPRPMVGALNLYSRSTAGLDDAAADAALLLSVYGALALAASVALDSAGQRIEQLTEAVTSRSIIGQAQGILMERHRLTAGQAFDRLRAASQGMNRKLRDVAVDLVRTGVDFSVPWALRRREEIEAARIAAVRRYDILDTPPDGAFDNVAAVAARAFGVPMATVSIVDTDRVWFKATRGLPGVRQIGTETGLSVSAMAQDEPYLVSDAAADPRAARHPLVTGGPRIRFYAAAPIVTTDGHHLGTVDVMDTQPREATPDQLEILSGLAAIVADKMELRLSALRSLGELTSSAGQSSTAATTD